MTRVRPRLLLVVVLLGSYAAWGRAGAASQATGAAPDVRIRHLPEKVWTVPEGQAWEPDESPASGYAHPHNLTWLYHLVLESRHARPLAIDSVDVTLTKADTAVWRQTLPRPYLARMEWLGGAFDMTAEYYLTKVLHGREVPTGPTIPPKETLSWVRIPLAAPWYVDADAIVMDFHFTDGGQPTASVRHVVPVSRYRQKVTLRLPVDGIWTPNAGNDLSTGHRRTGLNGLTSYAWDFVKLGPDGMPYKTDGKTPQDYYTYGQTALAAADGTVLHVRNDIQEFGVGEAPPAELLRKDGDAFAGNLVVLDHGNGEFSLTSHLRDITVRIGDRVKAGQKLGVVGNSGFSGVPHVHFNLMDSGKWLEARGLPSLFSNFERIRTGGPPELIPLGNPMSAWLVRMAPRK